MHNDYNNNNFYLKLILFGKSVVNQDLFINGWFSSSPVVTLCS